MAATGEERLLTLFGDVHYYFSEPSPRPVHHRFDKESYVYLYRDGAQHRGRLEIANHAGSPHQDAFTGYLDNAKISQSHRHPTLVSVAVDGAPARLPGAQQSEHHWRLPSTDPRDEGKYLFRMHTLDLYFWTADDARMFVASARAALRPDQLDVDVPPGPAAGAMSPVVQNLEHMAISDPAYQQRQQSRDSRSDSAAAGAAAAAVAAAGAAAATHHTEGRPEQHDPAAFAPLAYNPSAPPPPEEIKHRERTPPPPDAAVGTGLAQAAYADHQPPMQPGLSGMPPPPPPPGHPAASQPYPGSPPLSAGYAGSQPGSHRQSIASQTYTPASAGSGHGASPTPSASAQARYTPSAIDPARQPLDSPTAEILGSDVRRHPVTHLQPQYADYLGSRPQSQSPQHPQHQQPYHAPGEQPYWQANPYGTGDHTLHSQVYVPGDGEGHAYGLKPGRQSSAAAQGGQAGRDRKWENRAEKAEKGLGKLFKKVEKKIG